MRWGTANVAKHRTSLWTALQGSVPHVRSLAFSAHATAAGRAAPAPPEVHAPLRDLLLATTTTLATTFAGRNLAHLPILRACEEWLLAELQDAARACPGIVIERQAYRVGGSRGQEVANYHATIPGSQTPARTIVVGSHYDAITLRDGLGPAPAANDNASGVAATLALLRAFAHRASAGQPPACTLRFSLWVNEEPPYFWTDAMGSLVDARARKAAGEHIVAMLTPETIGCFRTEPGSQAYPPLPGLRSRFGDAGDYIALVGMSESRSLVARCVELLRTHSHVRCAGAALPAFVPGVGASDHWSFWRMGYPALMITDTAPFRYPYYHTPDDTTARMDFATMAHVVLGIGRVVEALDGSPVGTAPPPR